MLLDDAADSDGEGKKETDGEEIKDPTTI